jgi:hypothetical protein
MVAISGCVGLSEELAMARRKIHESLPSRCCARAFVNEHGDIVLTCGEKLALLL